MIASAAVIVVTVMIDVYQLNVMPGCTPVLGGVVAALEF